MRIINLRFLEIADAGSRVPDTRSKPFDPESLDTEPFGPESFDPELTTEGLATEGLMPRGFRLHVLDNGTRF